MESKVPPPPRAYGRHPGRRRCGTYQEYHRHRYYNEEPCDDCKQAWADHMAAYRNKERKKLL